MERPSDSQLNQWKWRAWGLTATTILTPYLVMPLSMVLFERFAPGTAEDEWSDPVRSRARMWWEFGGATVSILAAIGLQLAAIRYGMRLARWRPWHLWWVAPQMIFVFVAISELFIWIVSLLFGQGQTALQMIALAALTLPVVLSAVIGSTIWWIRAVLAAQSGITPADIG